MTGPDGTPGDPATSWRRSMLAVDLGTSHTVAMLRRPDGRTRPLLFDGRPLLPSAVYLDATGRLHVGSDAVRLGQAEPARIEPHPKRHIDADSVLLGGAEVPVADLFAALLGAVAREAVATAGFLPPAVLTHPASWGATRRAVLTEALVRAGWPAGTRLAPEPVAAARYFTDVLRRPVPVGSALAVFDFGGGTLDVAVVRNDGPGPDGRPHFAVASCGGADDLGGLDVDAALVDHLGETLADGEPAAWTALTDPATLAQWRARRQFWEDVRGAKEMLSRSALAPVPVPGVEHAAHLTRDHLEESAGPLVRRGVAEAAMVIKAAGLRPSDLAGLFLVGGSSRVPMVARLLHSELGIAPTVLEQPELPVAEGAIVAVAGSAPGSSPDGAVATRPTAGAPESSPAAAAGAPEREYAEPVDPWATGEAAAFAASGGVPLLPETGAPVGTPGHGAGSWLASTREEQPPGGGDAPVTAYRKKGVWLVAAALVLVVVAGATLAVIFWPGYRALQYRSLAASAPVTLAPAVPMTSGYQETAVIGDRAYFAAVSGAGVLGVVAADTGTGKRLWASTAASTTAGVVPGPAVRWEQMTALPDAVVVFTDTDSATGKRWMVVLDAARGDVRWHRQIDDADGVLFGEGVAVLVDRAENRLLGLRLADGTPRWQQPNMKTGSGTTTSVVAVSTPADLSGPATVSGVPFAPDLDDDTRIVQINADKSFRVLDATDGEILVAPRQGAAAPEDEKVAHNGRLIVREGGTVQRLLSYDLDELGEPVVLHSAAADVRISRLTSCGPEQVCWIETPGFNGKDARVAGVHAVKGGDVWRRPLPDADSLVPVGDHLLAGQSTVPKVALIDAGGRQVWNVEGQAARLDGGNLLRFNEALSTTPDAPALYGEHLGDEAVPLGALSNVRSQTCSWNTSVIACVADENFVLHRFAD